MKLPSELTDAELLDRFDSGEAGIADRMELRDRFRKAIAEIGYYKERHEQLQLSLRKAMGHLSNGVQQIKTNID